ncbi:hypothetical protein H632_c3459p0, partial [Helicosporidium sp. ATCC 50920]
QPIFSVTVQPRGPRFATGGGDGRVKVWSLPHALDAEVENGPTPPLLAALVEHDGPVNVVRFSPFLSSQAPQRLASGSDDGMACVFELRAGPGACTLGSEAPNVENWRLRCVLRGHANHVVDLAWSADGDRLATASLDGTAGLWCASTGARLRSLGEHASFVKGVAFDPVGSYLATQSDDRSVAVWRLEDGSLVARVTQPFSQIISSTFATRLAWSPDGQSLLAVNSYQGATHAAVLIRREQWTKAKEYLLVAGHAGSVVAAAFCPLLFDRQGVGEEEGGGRGSEGDQAAPVLPGSDENAAENGEPRPASAKASEPPGQQPLDAIFALGSQDRSLTVWAAGCAQPIFCASKLFRGQALDLAWASSGYALLA